MLSGREQSAGNATHSTHRATARGTRAIRASILTVRPDAGRACNAACSPAWAKAAMRPASTDSAEGGGEENGLAGGPATHDCLQEHSVDCLSQELADDTGRVVNVLRIAEEHMMRIVPFYDSRAFDLALE